MKPTLKGLEEEVLTNIRRHKAMLKCLDPQDGPIAELSYRTHEHELKEWQSVLRMLRSKMKGEKK